MERTDAFDALFFGHAARMVRLARLLGDDDPEDVVQESFCKLYAARSRLQHDDHRVCRSCGRTVEVEGPTVERWADGVAGEHGFTEVSHTLEIFGTCPDC